MQSRKKRRVGGNAAFQAQQKLAAEVARLPAGRQAEWLRASWRSATKVSDLETEVITGASLRRTLVHHKLLQLHEQCGSMSVGKKAMRRTLVHLKLLQLHEQHGSMSVGKEAMQILCAR